MKNTEKIEQKFQKLLTEGQTILAQGGWNGRFWNKFPSDQDFLRLRTECLNLIKLVCGETSEHYQELRRLSEDPTKGNHPSYLPLCIGILEAAHNDFTEDFLFDLRSLISAELFGDLLDQAENLLAQGYYVPAASLVGAVLEDTLRKISEKNNIPVPEKTKIDPLNIALAKAGVYNTLVQKEITAKADIRNNADHGQINSFSKDDVEDMLKWVKRFESEYLQA